MLKLSLKINKSWVELYRDKDFSGAGVQLRTGEPVVALNSASDVRWMYVGSWHFSSSSQETNGAWLSRADGRGSELN